MKLEHLCCSTSKTVPLVLSHLFWYHISEYRIEYVRGMYLIVSTMPTSASFALNWTMYPEDNGSFGTYVGAFVLSYPWPTVRSITLTTVNPAIERGYRFVIECGCGGMHYVETSIGWTKSYYFLKAAKPIEDLVDPERIWADKITITGLHIVNLILRSVKSSAPQNSRIWRATVSQCGGGILYKYILVIEPLETALDRQTLIP